MQFQKRLREGIRQGAITLTVRIWTRPHVIVGRRYAMEDGAIEVVGIEPITADDVTAELARQCGFRSVLDLLAVAQHGRGTSMVLVRFRYIGPDAPEPPSTRGADLPGSERG